MSHRSPGTLLDRLPKLLLVVGLPLFVAGFNAYGGSTNDVPAAKPQQDQKLPATTALPVIKDAVGGKDHFGDPLPDGALARLGTIRFRHGLAARALTFTPDGKTLASTGNPGGVCLWEAATGRLLRTLGPDGTFSIAISPHGKLLAAASPGLLLFDLATGKELNRLAKPGIFYEIVAFAPDSRTVAVSEFGGAAPAIVLWDAIAGKEIRRLEGHTDYVQSLAFSPDGKLLASSSDDNSIRLWDVANGKEILQIKPQADSSAFSIFPLAFSPDGKVLAAGGDGVIRLLDPATGKQIQKLKAEEGQIMNFVFSPDGKTLASAGRVPGVIRVWDLEIGKELHNWSAGGSYLTGLTFSPDGKVIASGGAWDSAIRLWDAGTGKEINPTPGHTGVIDQILFAPDGKTLFSSAKDRKAVEWDLTTGLERRSLFAQPMTAAESKWVYSVTDLSPDGKTLARAGRVIYKAQADPIIRLWDTAAGKKLNSLWGHLDTVTWLKFSPDGKLLASSASDGTRLWDVAAGGKQLHYLKQATAPIFSPDGKLLAFGGKDNTLCLWEIATAKEVRSWTHALPYIGRMAFAPDGKSIAISGGNQSGVGIWATDTGKQLMSFGVESFVDALAFSPSGRMLAVSDRRSRPLGKEGTSAFAIYLWEVGSGQKVREIVVPRTWTWSLAFSPDGRTLATGGVDSSVLLWDLTGHAKNGKVRAQPLAAKELDKLWTDLVGDAATADAALWTMTPAAKESVPFLKERLRPAVPAPAEQVAKLVADLQSDTFKVRQEAAKALVGLGAAVEVSLRKALEGNLALEARQRIEQVLEKRKPETLRILRAIAVLEQMGTAEARQVLAELTESTGNPRVREAGQAALSRMAKANAN